MSAIADRAANLIRRLSPEFRARPLYVVDAADLDSDTREAITGDGCVGRTGHVMDLILKSDLQRMGHWEGRGHAMVVDGESVDHELGFDVGYLCVALHEAAHCAEQDHAPLTRNAESDIPAWCAPELVLAAMRTPAPYPREPGPGFAHGLRFIRAAAHVAWRARCLEIPMLTLSMLGVAGPTYALSYAWRYQGVLSVEVRERRHESITAIIDSDPPQGLLDLYRYDTQPLEAQS